VPVAYFLSESVGQAQTNGGDTLASLSIRAAFLIMLSEPITSLNDISIEPYVPLLHPEDVLSRSLNLVPELGFQRLNTKSP
jgi:hypothetical protein